MNNRIYYDGTIIPVLYFVDLEKDPIFEDLNQYVFLILNLTSLYCTQGSYDGICYPGRNRSVGDLWRLCKYYKDDITLQDVMRTLFKLKDRLGTFVCWDIRKRIFYITDTSRNNDMFVDIDEYNLKFWEWEKIEIQDNECIYEDRSECFDDEDEDDDEW